MTGRFTSRGIAAVAAAVFLLLGAASLAAQEFPQEGKIYQRLQADLDGDGASETVALRAYRVQEDGFFGQVLVMRGGSTLWEGPRPSSPSDPMAFGSWDYGGADLQAAVDVDGDGRVEVLGALPQSDVSPTTFRVLSWNGKALRSLFARSLVERPSGSGRYPWTSNPEVRGLTRWIGSFGSATGGGTFNARIWESDGAMARVGTASVAPDAKGFHVVRWIQAPK